jgi:excinuclease ABC subunit B
VNAKVILYGDKVTDSMRKAIEETSRRRELQEKYNTEHGITPETVKKNIRAGIEEAISAHRQANAAVGRNDESVYITEEYVAELEEEMYEAAHQLDFEKAAALRDRIEQYREAIGKKLSEVQIKSYKPGPKTRKRKGGSQIPRPKKKA